MSMLGQTKIQKVISILIEAAKTKGEPIPHILFSGPSGYGKTAFALDIAKKQDKIPRQINSALLKKKLDILFAFHDIQPGEIIFLDEIHRLGIQSQEALYTAIDENYVNLTNNGTSIDRIELPKFTLIGATTQTVSPPLLNRFKHVFQMEPYSDEEMVEIANLYLKAYSIQLDPLNIISYARSNPRTLRNQLHWINDYCVANKTTDANSIISHAMMHKNVFPGGFTRDDLVYLHYLRDQREVGLNALVAATALDKKKITEEIEPFLLKKGLIIRSSHGRIVNLRRIAEIDSLPKP